MEANESKIRKIGDILVDVGKPLKARFRALFTLRNIGGELAIEMISACFSDDSDLLKHECAYCLGQMKEKAAIPLLNQVLNDGQQPVIVRHEAGEALAAIGDTNSINILLQHSDDNDQSIRETCELAIESIIWQADEKRDTPLTFNPYASIDPAPASAYGDIDQLGSELADDLPIFQRYRAMFSLRNIGSEKAILHLANGLKCPLSALYRHEIAYVLGQAQHPAAVTALVSSLGDENENAMVRHECAEALGAIATEDCKKALKQFLHSDVRIVRESCEVALDMCEYECDGAFQYADGLKVIGK